MIVYTYILSNNLFNAITLDEVNPDEVLDSADEQGLASVFKALNKTQLTSLVVVYTYILSNNLFNAITLDEVNQCITESFMLFIVVPAHRFRKIPCAALIETVKSTMSSSFYRHP